MKKQYDLGLLIMRVGFGALMLTHGIPKLFKLISGDFSFGDPIGIGPTASLILTVIAEAICPILIIIGLKTRLSAIPVVITMAVAAFIVHAGDPIATKEKALLYLVGFLGIALMGGGRFGLSRS